MSKELIDKLSKLKITEASLKRALDTSTYSSKSKSRVFNELKYIENEIKKIKFKLKMEKELRKNETGN